MAARAQEPTVPPDGRRLLGRGMEQFHHPRPVCVGGRSTPQRERLLSGLTGRVLEIGAGDGVKVTCYPETVEEIVLVESDPFLRSAARLAADEVMIPVRILDGELTGLPVPDASFDAVVMSLVLCCSPSAMETLQEVRRVLRTGGQLHFYEHQRSGNQVIALCENLVSPLWSRALGGCHPARDTLAALQHAGFAVDGVERFAFRHVSHVLGTARPR
ncbi:class I SAM-dependent methyltransferase [Nonomuraea sp. NPDC049152]|uniref:class I SAM-dependent methyltransferase n=1 Tax=Nonomuraea sp. NPDC049152 TaxID=3154350 RepID=UPI0033EEE8CD